MIFLSFLVADMVLAEKRISVPNRRRMSVGLPWLRPKEAWVTCRDRDDGGGAQIMARASAMIFAGLRGACYAHSPMTDVAHVPEGMDPGEWSEKWERFFSLGKDEVQAEEIEARGLPMIRLSKPHRRRLRSRTLHVVAHCHKVTDRHPEAWAEIAPVLRERYLSTPKPALPADPPGAIRIAVHLRRGDVDAEGEHSERFTPNSAVLAHLNRVLEALGPEREHAVVRVFSQGNPEDFAAFADQGARLHLDEDVFTSFHHMFRAHVLFTAKSTFSYLAGLLGGGLCLYEPFRHPPLPDWIPPVTLDATPLGDLAQAIQKHVENQGLRSGL